MRLYRKLRSARDARKAMQKADHWAYLQPGHQLLHILRCSRIALLCMGVSEYATGTSYNEQGDAEYGPV